MNLDEIDSQILKILLDNSRASISSIAKELGLSRPTVRKRLKNLVKSGVIKGFSILVDEALLRGFQVICLFKALDAEEIVQKLKGLNEVSQIYVTTGEKNVVCIARIADLKTFEDLLNEFTSYNIPFEVHIVLKSEKKPLSPTLIRIVKITCDYCGKEITGKPLTYTLHNKKYNLCCPTCFREFSKKMKLVLSRK